MHHFPFHISDFAQATAKFSAAQVGVLVVLLMEYYKTEKPLPNDEEELFFLTGASSASEKQTVRWVLKRCFVLSETGEHYHQRRADREMESYRRKCLHNTYAILCRFWEKVNPGHSRPTLEQFTASPDRYYNSVTGKIRQFDGREVLVLRSYDDRITDGLPSNNQDPVASNQEPITSTPVVPKGTPSIESLAEAIYALYPRKVGKPVAIRAILKVLKSGTITELELQRLVGDYARAVEKWPPEARYTKDGNDTVPHPSTWFNQRRFEDDPSTWTREPAPGAKKKEGGGAGVTMSASQPPAQVIEAPEGWERAMDALWGKDWRQWYAAFETMPPADQRQVHAWLAREKKEGGARD